MRQRSPRAESEAVRTLTGQVETIATNWPVRWTPQHEPPCDPVDIALTAVGYAIDLRDVVRRRGDMLDDGRVP